MKPPSAGSPDITRIYYNSLKMSQTPPRNLSKKNYMNILPGPSLPYELAISPTWHRPRRKVQRLRQKCASRWSNRNEQIEHVTNPCVSHTSTKDSTIPSLKLMAKAGYRKDFFKKHQYGSLFRAVPLPSTVEGEVFSKLKTASVMSWISLATCNVFVLWTLFFFGQDFRMVAESRLRDYIWAV